MVPENLIPNLKACTQRGHFAAVLLKLATGIHDRPIFIKKKYSSREESLQFQIITIAFQISHLYIMIGFT
jgi:hypothetical protein